MKFARNAPTLKHFVYLVSSQTLHERVMSRADYHFPPFIRYSSLRTNVNPTQHVRQVWYQHAIFPGLLDFAIKRLAVISAPTAAKLYPLAIWLWDRHPTAKAIDCLEKVSSKLALDMSVRLYQ